MGEIADAVIEGMLCELCGVYIGIGPGYPRKCEDCEKELQNENHNNRSGKNKKRKNR
jgi:hypothetical protein